MHSFLRKSFFEYLVFAFLILFVGKGTTFINVLHPGTLQWLPFFILFLYLILNKKIYISGYSAWVIILFIYLFWCMATALWSVQQMISLPKSIMFALLVLTMIWAGQLWVVRLGYEKCMSYLFPLLIITLISGLLGAHVKNAYEGLEGRYMGLSGGTNNFGFLAATISSLILWQLYRARWDRFRSIFWGMLFLFDVRFLLMSHSRSATALLCVVLYFFIISLSVSKKIFIATSALFLLTTGLLIIPITQLEVAIFQYVNKDYGKIHVLDSEKIFHSRQDVWEKSYKLAMKGGLYGVGFGADIAATNSTKKSQREKGNSQLAIIEETGWVGFILYCLLLLSFYLYSILFYLRQNGAKKVAMGLMLGAISGLLVESIVEAWWDSLGPETGCFWILVGAVIGMKYLERKRDIAEC